jgi:hypothetical protein
VRDLLLDRDAEVLQGGVAEAVEVQEQVVEVQSFGAMERSRAPGPLPQAGRHRWVPFQRLGVVLVLGAVVGAAVRPDQRWVQMRHRVVGLLRRGGCGSRTPLARRGRVDLPAEVRVHGLPRLLEVSDRLARDVLDDRLQAPAGATPGRCVGVCPVPHAGEAASPDL